MLTPICTDKRGVISMVIAKTEHPIGSISRIYSNAGATRANHYHKEDGHTILVNQGMIELYERPVGSLDKPTLTILRQGDIFFTGPQIEHTMFFPQDTLFDCYSILPRDQETYENETVRFNDSLKDVYDHFKV